MSVKLAYLGIIIIWSTTPLAIQWSSEPFPLFSAMARMIIGLFGCLLMIKFLRIKVSFDRHSMPLFLVTGTSVFLAMSTVYLAARLIPSGWISVLFGLSPIFTGVCARYVLQENNLSWNKIIGMLCGFTGLCFVFSSGLSFDNSAVWGIVLCLFSVFITSCSTVIIKKLNQQTRLSGVQTNVGGLVIALPLFIVTWLALEYHTQPMGIDFASIPMRSYLSIVYTGIIATSLGFTLFYYLLKNIDATRVSMIALITPLTALFLGSWLNDEPVVWTVWLGATFICSGLLLFEFNIQGSCHKLYRYFSKA